MGILDLPIFGTPKDHSEEKKKNEVVETPEFDITQYAKKLGVIIGVLVGATAAALKLFKVEQVTSGMVIAALGVTAVCLLGICIVSAVDIAARAYITGQGAAQKKKTEGDDGDTAASGDDPPVPASVVPAPRGMLAWLEDGDDPYPVLAISGDGAKASSYLIASGGSVQRQQGDKDVTAIDGAPKWLSADKIRAVRPAKWD